jgi:hypothetical protein
MRRLLRNLITTSILAEFGGKSGLGSPSDRDWRGLMDADLDVAGQRSTLKHELEEQLLRPQLAKENSYKAFLMPPECSPSAARGAAMSQQVPQYSAILFGPPGTVENGAHTCGRLSLWF